MGRPTDHFSNLADFAITVTVTFDRGARSMLQKKPGSGLAFVSYRSSDSSFAAAAIADRLIRQFGQHRVFLDRNSLEAAAPYPPAIRESLDNSSLLVAVIGPQWLSIIDESGHRLIDRHNDWVRRELTEAFRRRIKVLPVLLKDTPDNARMPQAHELPKGIEELANIQALSLSPSRLSRDLDDIVGTIRRTGLVSELLRRSPSVRKLGAVIALTLAFFSLPMAPADPVPVTSNLPSVDPCSVANQVQRQLAYLGNTEIDGHADNFDVCHVYITPPDGSLDVRLQVQLPDSPDRDATSTTKIGSMTIERQQLANSECHRIVTTADIAFDVGMIGQHADLCRLADVATSAVVSRLIDGTPLSQRPIPSSSLASRNACGLLDAPALTAAGVSLNSIVGGFGGWECWFGDNGATVDLRFDQGQPNGGSPSTVGSRIAYREPDGDGGDRHNCVIKFMYRPINVGGSQKAEWVHLTLYGEPSSESLCAPAATLAANAESHLPH
jgi:TIR domain